MCVYIYIYIYIYIGSDSGYLRDESQIRSKSIQILMLNFKSIPNLIGYAKWILLGFGMDQIPENNCPIAFPTFCLN